MKRHFTKEQVQDLPKYDMVNLVNGITGYKSANLIGTKGESGTNLAVFNSVTHLGSSPALITFTLRPHTVERHSYENILKFKFFTINHINATIIKQAHQTAARFEREESEFEGVGLNEEYLNDFYAPYVKESEIKLGCKYVNSYEIKENGCLLVVAAIEEFHFNDEFVSDDYWIDLEKANSVAISGLDTYALPKILDRFAYAKKDQQVESIINK